jgi:hypothetical protein
VLARKGKIREERIKVELVKKRAAWQLVHHQSPGLEDNFSSPSYGPVLRLLTIIPLFLLTTVANFLNTTSDCCSVGR